MNHVTIYQGKLDSSIPQEIIKDYFKKFLIQFSQELLQGVLREFCRNRSKSRQNIVSRLPLKHTLLLGYHQQHYASVLYNKRALFKMPVLDTRCDRS